MFWVRSWALLWPERRGRQMVPHVPEVGKSGWVFEQSSRGLPLNALGRLGDPTLATREKCRVVVEATVKAILADIAMTRTAALPQSPSAE
jgi:creatinine amidohydrolase/Fe(II)-dependent formamide hydrolase-like protein